MKSLSGEANLRRWVRQNAVVLLLLGIVFGGIIGFAVGWLVN